MKSLGYYNGSYGELDAMYIPINDRVCVFGDGVYDAAYCYNHKIFALDEHVDRFFSSAELLSMRPAISKEELKSLTARLAEKVDDDKLFIYWQLTRGTQAREHVYPDKLKTNLWIMIKHGELRDMSKPIKVILADDRRHTYCNVKTLNLIPNILALKAAEQVGADEVIFHRSGRITECAHSNVHVLKDGTLITPPSDNLILSGIGRVHLMAICKKLGIDCVEKEFYIDDLFNADEIIVTAAGSLCITVGILNDTQVGGKASELIKKIRSELIGEFNKFTGSNIINE